MSLARKEALPRDEGRVAGERNEKSRELTFLVGKGDGMPVRAEERRLGNDLWLELERTPGAGRKERRVGRSGTAAAAPRWT